MSTYRIAAAVIVVLAYLAMCARCLRPLWRRRTAAVAGTAGRNATLIAYASQTGFAEQLAERTAHSRASLASK